MPRTRFLNAAFWNVVVGAIGPSGMDESIIQTLKTAYQAAPDNFGIFEVLLKALWESGEVETAYLLIEEKPLDFWPEGGNRDLPARIALTMNDPERALTFASGNTPDTLLLQARALAMMGKRDEAQRAYNAALAANPALEDVELARLIAGESTDVGEQEELVFTEANDDTDATEMTRILQPESSKVTFSDVGGLDDVKRQIHKRVILPYQKPGLFQRFRKQHGGGILLYGAPGCGKTLLARATAGECQARFYNVTISDVLDMYIGESERKLHAIFEHARLNSPSVLFFDELEALGGKRQYTREATSSKLVSIFLSEMDGFAQNNAGVLVLGATNVPWAIDPAFRRPGRFDRVLFVPPPDFDARLAILRMLMADRPAAPGIDLAAVARKTTGFSGADLRNLVETAADEAIEATLEAGGEVPISPLHLHHALLEVKPTTLEWLTTARNYARYANEAGHYNEVLQYLDKHGKR